MSKFREIIVGPILRVVKRLSQRGAMMRNRKTHECVLGELISHVLTKTVSYGRSPDFRE